MATSGTEWNTEAPSPTSTIPTAATVRAPTMPLCGPKRASAAEEAARPVIAPMDIPRMSSPIADGSLPRPSPSRTPGMRATQLAMVRPLRMKITNTALRHAVSSRRLRRAVIGCDIAHPAVENGRRIVSIETIRLSYHT